MAVSLTSLPSGAKPRGMTTLLYVALGGALGASARYLTGMVAVRMFGSGFPWGTLTVNVLGSLAMGVLAVALMQNGGSRAMPFLMTGLLGGFTTFSAFSLDTVTLVERGEITAAMLYAGGSVILSIGALLLGLMLARGIWA